jgi:hypothetical protein
MYAAGDKYPTLTFNVDVLASESSFVLQHLTSNSICLSVDSKKVRMRRIVPNYMHENKAYGDYSCDIQNSRPELLHHRSFVSDSRPRSAANYVCEIPMGPYVACHCIARVE